MTTYTKSLSDFQNSKEDYEKADSNWLIEKIQREKESIKINQEMINLSQNDISIIQIILNERQTCHCGRTLKRYSGDYVWYGCIVCSSLPHDCRCERVKA